MLEVNAAELPPSKSLYNRALIIKSFAPALNILSNSEHVSEDVLLLSKALEELSEGKTTFYCGAGAAPLKFLAIRLSREIGNFSIRGTERLFSRPLEDLKFALEKLGCSRIEFSKDLVSFDSTAKWPMRISIDAAKSSQVLSAILLSSWELDHEVRVEITTPELASISYVEMTLGLLRGAGWAGDVHTSERLEAIILPKNQSVVLDEISIEPDMSCVAVLALIGALKDGIRFTDMPSSSLQGDSVIFPILKSLQNPERGGDAQLSPEDLSVNVPKVSSFEGFDVDLIATPDLFPVLAAFSVAANSSSTFSGLQNLNFKESKRLGRIHELFNQLGIECKASQNSFKVMAPTSMKTHTLTFNPDQDHRLAMAAALLKLQGANIQIENPEVVNKSFPNFWKYI